MINSSKDNGNIEILNCDKKELQNKLKYIDNYPSNWKYISLFAKTGV
jgi:hypothetical protein